MSYYDDLPYHVSGMQLADIDEVMAIEVQAFSSPWSARAYRYEVGSNSFSHFVVVRQAVPGVTKAAEPTPNFIDRCWAPRLHSRPSRRSWGMPASGC